MNWIKAISLAELSKRSRAVVKLRDKQILLLQSGGKIYACNNRCPHEGYPLSEGTISGACILTCNWHNWRFNLEDGATLVGGDALTVYPHEIRDDDIWLDLTEPPATEVRQKALAGLHEAFIEYDYGRIARELARFEQAEGDPLEAIANVLEWAMHGLKNGTTHAQAAAPDWLALRSSIDSENAVDQLIPVVEIIGHLSWDVLMRKGPFPIAEDKAERFDADIFQQAIEDENEVLAIAQARAGLYEDGSDRLRPFLERASLRHYQGFGHSVIYLDKTYELIDRLGMPSEEALILPLVRCLCSLAREDLIPEFKNYAPMLAAWDGKGRARPDPDMFRNKSVEAALEIIVASSGEQEALYNTLMHAAFDAMLHYDARYRTHTDKSVQQNVDWLSFTHAITHLSSARKVCTRQPDLWPNALLQTGCFLGRNAKFVDWRQDTSQWAVEDGDKLIDEVLYSLLDHGEPLYIYPAHTLKFTTALKTELAFNPDASWQAVALAALNRFANEPMKKKHVRRTVTQASHFVNMGR